MRAPCIGSLPIIGALQVKLGFSGPAFSVFGTDYETPDGTAIRDYVHVTDLADAPARAVDHLSEGGENVALKLGTGEGTSVLEIVNAVSEVTGRKAPMINAPRRPGDPPILYAVADRAAETLGWTPRFLSIRDAVGTAEDWFFYRSHNT